VQSELLCTEPPPPPPDVPPLPQGAQATGTQRQILEAHRAQPQCRACHELIDGIGFALERYDAVGAWRDTDKGRPIDDQGSFPDGTQFKGPRELARVLARDARFASCVIRNLVSFATGRTVGPSDEPYLAELERAGAAGGQRLEDLIARIAGSELFRMRRGTAEQSGGTP
jgi:hypothetical protein